MRAKHIIGDFEGQFWGSKKSMPPRKTSRNRLLCVLPSCKKEHHKLLEPAVHWHKLINVSGFFGAEMALADFRAQKSLDFWVYLFQWPLYRLPPPLAVRSILTSYHSTPLDRGKSITRTREGMGPEKRDNLEIIIAI
jgi:hypothetical protein